MPSAGRRFFVALSLCPHLHTHIPLKRKKNTFIPFFPSRFSTKSGIKLVHNLIKMAPIYFFLSSFKVHRHLPTLEAITVLPSTDKPPSYCLNKLKTPCSTLTSDENRGIPEIKYFTAVGTQGVDVYLLLFFFVYIPKYFNEKTQLRVIRAPARLHSEIITLKTPEAVWIFLTPFCPALLSLFTLGIEKRNASL